MKKLFSTIVALGLLLSGNAYSNEIIFKKCIKGSDGTLIDDKKNKEFYNKIKNCL